MRNLNIKSNIECLVVDDDRVNHLIVKKYLERVNLNSVGAYSGKEAIDLYAKHRSTLKNIILDISMPIMDGYELTRTIRSLDQDINIIALTANAYQSDKEKCLAAGCTHYISKPFSFEQLYSALKKL